MSALDASVQLASQPDLLYTATGQCEQPYPKPTGAERGPQSRELPLLPQLYFLDRIIEELKGLQQYAPEVRAGEEAAAERRAPVRTRVPSGDVTPMAARARRVASVRGNFCTVASKASMPARTTLKDFTKLSWYDLRLPTAH